MTGEHAVQFGQKLQEAIEAKAKTVRGRRDVISANAGDRYAIIVSRGLIGLYRDRPSTNRLVALRYAGEVVQPHEAGLRVHALVESEVLLADPEAYSEIVRSQPELGRMAIESVHRAQLIAYEWLLRDAMDAASRMAHFLCEHALRSKGRHTDSLEMPITQAQMGHVTAQTSVNVNRVLRLLEKDGLLMPIGERRFRADWDELRRLGRFDPAYLDRR